jgi:hypothetical protein
VKGKNLETLFSDILNYLRGVQLCRLLSNPEAVLESDPESIERFRQLGENINIDTIQILMENLSSVGRILHDAINKQVFLETVILKAMRMAHSVKISDLVARLNQLRKAGDLKFLDQIPAASSIPAAKTVVSPVEVPVSEEKKSEPESSDGQAGVNTEAIDKPEIKLEEKIDSSPVAATKEVEPEPRVESQEKRSEPAEKPEEQKKQEAASPEKAIKQQDSEQELGFDPMPEPEPAEDEFTANGLWQKIISYLKSEKSVDPVVMNYMNEGNPKKFDKSVLSVEFYDEFEPEHYSAIKKILPSIQIAIQSITNDWAANVDLVHKRGVPAFHHKNTSDIPEPEPEELAVSEENADLTAELPVDPELAEKSEDTLSSIIGDKEVLEKVREKTIVKDSLDLFGGNIVDIHG